MSKLCGNGCGIRIWWNDERKENPKIKWEEVSTGLFHDYKRCAEIMKEKGMDVSQLNRTKKKGKK